MEKFLKSSGTWIATVVLIAIGLYGRTFASDAVTAAVIAVFILIWLIAKNFWDTKPKEKHGGSKSEPKSGRKGEQKGAEADDRKRLT